VTPKRPEATCLIVDRGLDLLERHRLAGRPELHEAPQQAVTDRLVVGQARELGIGLARFAVARVGGIPYRMLERRDRVGVPHVQLAVAPPLEHAAHGEYLPVRARVRAEVALDRLLGQLLEPHAADP